MFTLIDNCLIFSVPRNYDPSLHPFEAPREYTKALNAVKLERVFAKPFVGSLEGHKDSVFCICKHPTQLSTLLSGAYDGEVRTWNLAQRTSTRAFLAHDGIIRGITYAGNGKHFITIGDDKTIKTWNAESVSEQEEPLNTIICKVRNLYIQSLYFSYVEVFKCSKQILLTFRQC